jgi:FeS assembly SUF system regulator
MIILSKLADYGVIIATQLAATPVQMTAAQLAATTVLPQTTVAKVLKLLGKGGIVTALRGAAGGYRLAREPEDVTISDIVTAIDGAFALTECTSHAGPCVRNQFCPTRPHWAKINDAVERALRQVTLSEMRKPEPSFSAAGTLFAQFSPASHEVSP